jgi:hypothetical protein
VPRRSARLRMISTRQQGIRPSIFARFYKHKLKRGQSTRFALHSYNLNAHCRGFPFNFHNGQVSVFQLVPKWRTLS